MANTIEQLERTALLALNKGDYRTLHQCCLNILSADEKHADAWFFLSIVTAAQQQMKKAIEFVDRALSITPKQSEYLSQKAKYHIALRQDNEALNAARSASNLNPSNALTLDTLGVVYTNLGIYDTASDHLSAAVKAQPNNPQFHFNFATSLQFLGNSSDAKTHFEEAIKLYPKFARAYWSLSELEKDKLDGSRTKNLESLMHSPNLKAEDELYIAHALSREYEQTGEYQKAFETLRKGKARRAEKLGYESNDDKKIFTKMHTEFSQLANGNELESKTSSLGQGVIFIVGMPRSGTTLIERILSSHSQVDSLGELQNFGLSVRQFVDSNSPKALDEEIISKAIKLDPEQIGQQYLVSLFQRRPNSAFFIDKMPLNFLYIGFIRRCLPAAKIVCLRRNPLDTCLSNYRQLFAINFSYYNYHYDIEDTARYYSYFHQLMRFWKDIYGESIHEVVYEELTQDPEKIIHQLLDYIGLEYQESCMEFHKNKSAVSTPSASQVREKLYTKAVGRWQKYENELQEVMRYFDSQGISYR